MRARVTIVIRHLILQGHAWLSIDNSKEMTAIPVLTRR